MGPLIGYLSVPRPSENLRPAGAFLSAVVLSKVGHDSWKVELDGRPIIVATPLNLAPGQVLRLKIVNQEKGQWVLGVISSFQKSTAPQKSAAGPTAPLVTSLGQEFLAQGLPPVVAKLSQWTRWTRSFEGPSDQEAWAASLEARQEIPEGPMAGELMPWLEWQAGLERGENTPPPGDDDIWDRWNTRKTKSGDPWLIMPLKWEYQGTQEAGLLKAHWNPPSGSIDSWNLTAAPRGTAFRLAARVIPGKLDLTWTFFKALDREFWARRILNLAEGLTTPDLEVKLQVAPLWHPPGPVSRMEVDLEI